MSPEALWQLIENLIDKQMEVVKETCLGGFLHLQADIIPWKLAQWLVRNFDASSCSLPLIHGRIRVTEPDVHMKLALLKGPLHAS